MPTLSRENKVTWLFFSWTTCSLAVTDSNLGKQNNWYPKRRVYMESRSNLGGVHITQRNLKTQLYISTVRPTVHTNPSRKRSFSKTLLKPEEFQWKRRLFVFFMWTDNNLKTELFSYDNHLISLTKCFSNTNPNLKWLMIAALLNSSSHSYY